LRPFQLPLIISLELTRSFNCPHADLTSKHLCL
jgi:hypothetical protein